jgi:hypothetical protein
MLRRLLNGHYDVGSRRRQRKQKYGGREGKSGARQGYLPSSGWRKFINLDKNALVEDPGSLSWSPKENPTIMRSTVVS